MKAQHEGALTPACIVQKNPQVPQTFRQVACHPVNNSKGKRRSIPQQKTRCDSLVPTLQGPWDPSKRRCLRALDPSNPSTSPSPSCGHPSDGPQTIPSASLSSLYTACAKLCSNARADNLGVPCHDGCHFKCRPLCLQSSGMDLPLSWVTICLPSLLGSPWQC